MLNKGEIRFLLKCIKVAENRRDNSGYSEDPKVGNVEAALSMMLQTARDGKGPEGEIRIEPRAVLDTASSPTNRGD